MKGSAANHFFEDVYRVVASIPCGQVTTYGFIADHLALGSARMVGWALRNSIELADIPAHRVVNRKGELSGRHRFSPPELMAALLQEEGVTVVDDRVQNLDEHLWYPDNDPDLD